MLTDLEKELIKTELKYSFARSSGPGGQNVNKTNTKVVLIWNFDKSDALSEVNKSILTPKLLLKFPNGNLKINVEQTRSQFQNREIAFEKLISIINKFLYINPLRKVTKVKKSAIEDRLKSKKKLSYIKITRKKPNTDLND